MGQLHYDRRTARGMVASDHGAGADPTVCDPVSRAKIQAHYGVDLNDVDPRTLEFVVEQSRRAGNQAFKARQYKGEMKQNQRPFPENVCAAEMGEDG